MRKLFISMVLVLSTYMIQAQEYGVYSMHFVRIEGNTADFEKVQSMYMQKVAKEATEKRRYHLLGISETCDHGQY